MSYVDEIELILKAKDFDPKDKILITGFHSELGEAGYMVLRHLVAQKEAQSIGCIMSPLVPPHIFLTEGRILMPIELYSFADQFILLFTRLQLHRAEWAPFAEFITTWSTENNLKEAILLGGLDIQFTTNTDQFRTAYTAAYRQKAEKFDFPILEEGRGIYGPLALLLANFEIRNFPALVLLPYAERGRPDPRAASVAINILNRLYDLTINTEDLVRDAEVIEKEIKQILERQREREEDRGLGGMFV
jgi:uncharacterized protein